MTSPTAAGSAPAPTTPAQRATLEHLRLIAVGDMDRWALLFDDDAIMTFPFAPNDMVNEVRGREQLLEHMHGFPATFDVRAVNVRFIDTADPLTAVAEFGLSGHARATGKPFEQGAITVVHTRDNGLIREFHDYWNPLTAIEALRPDDGATPLRREGC